MRQDQILDRGRQTTTRTNNFNKLGNRLVLRVAFTLPLIILWAAFDESNQNAVLFWDFFSLDITKKYNLFLFAPNSQYLRWYVHYTSYYVTLIVLSDCVLLVARKLFNNKIQGVIYFFYLFSIFRAVEYWLFRFNITIVSAIAGLTLFMIFTLKYQWRKYL